MVEPNGCKSNYWLQTLVLDTDSLDQRDDLLRATNNAGIMTRPAWALMHELAQFKQFPRMDLSCAELILKSIINIPSSSSLVRNES